MEITVYSALWCPDCREAKRFLDRHQLPYTDINIETTPGAADEVVKRTGKRAIPQFVIDGEWVQPYRPGEGFLYEEMAKRLGLSNSSVETGLPVSGSEALPRRGKPRLYGIISVTFGLLQPDFCTLHVWARMRQDSGYPDISILPGLTAHVQFR